MKGESSGHTQDVQAVFTDCDADTVLIKVKQHGVACHEGYRSCFFRQLVGSGRVERDRQAARSTRRRCTVRSRQHMSTKPITITAVEQPALKRRQSSTGLRLAMMVAALLAAVGLTAEYGFYAPLAAAWICLAMQGAAVGLFLAWRVAGARADESGPLDTPVLDGGHSGSCGGGRCGTGHGGGGDPDSHYRGGDLCRPARGGCVGRGTGRPRCRDGDWVGGSMAACATDGCYVSYLGYCGRSDAVAAGGDGFGSSKFAVYTSAEQSIHGGQRGHLHRALAFTILQRNTGAFGKAVALVLMQAGGLAVMVFGTLFGLLVARRLWPKQVEADGCSDGKRLGRLVMGIVVISLGFEMIGAVLLYPATAVGASVLRRGFESAFLAVSASATSGYVRSQTASSA